MPIEYVDTTNAKTCRACALARTGLGSRKIQTNLFKTLGRKKRNNMWNLFLYLNFWKVSSSQVRKEGKEAVG